MGRRHYTLSKLEHLTHELAQWKFERPLTTAAESMLIAEAREWRGFFEQALDEGWIDRVRG